MLERKQLKRLAGSTIYRRGVEIYEDCGVLEFRVDSDETIDRVYTRVKGSGRKCYDVEMAYDVVYDEIIDYYCECPAYMNYDGPCKHCVAIALEYMEYIERQNTIKMITRGEEKGILENLPATRTASGYSPGMKYKLRTTPALKEILEKQILNRSLPSIQKNVSGQVCLEPIMKIDNLQTSLEFRIGISHKYVIKDVFEFEERMKNYVEFSYGQKLDFIHTISAFEPKSIPLAEFLLNWVENNKARYVQSGYYGYPYGYQSAPKLRSIPLKGNELERFMAVMKDREFMAEINNLGERYYRLSEEKPDWKLHIAGKEKGIEIKPESFPYVTSDNDIYVFKESCIHRLSRREWGETLDFINCIENIPKKTAFVEEGDAVSFCRELLPALEEFFDCTYENFSTDSWVEEVSFEIYLDAPQKDMVVCRLAAVYGEKKYDVYKEAPVEGSRDIVKEIEAGAKISAYFNAYDGEDGSMVLANDEDKLYELLTVGLAEFRQLGEVFISESLKNIRVTPAPKVEMGISLSGDLLELTVTAEDMSLAALKEILSKYNKKKRYYRLGNGDFVDMEGEDVKALLEVKEGLGITDAQLGTGRIKVPRYRALYLDEECRSRKALSVIKSKDFRELVRNMKTVEDNDFEIPESLHGVLREYQKRGFLWLKTLQHNGFGGILADDMGLGKTLQVIAFLLSQYIETEEKQRKPVLIVCPASLVFNWGSELERFAPKLPARMIVGTMEERKDLLKQWQSGEILITSYDLLKRDREIYENMQFSCQIIDEAQYIKNHNTQTAKAVKEIQAGTKLALTGTPIENRLSELWSIFDYLMPGFLYSYQHFKSTFETPIVQEGRGENADRLQRMIRPFVLRRLKKDVLQDLPDKLEENMYVRLEGEQQKLYDAHVKRLTLMLDKHSDEEFRKNKIQVLAELTRLRQLCCDPALIYEDYKGESAKTNLCVDMIRNAVNGGHKLLLFSQFTTMLSYLCTRLEEENISFYKLTGADSKEKRRNMVEAFQKDDTPVFCISLKAGGTGLNLTAADMVIHYDPWWNVAVQNQATDRAHRIGQQNVVNVYRLIAKHTIEEKIVKLQDKKQALAEQLLGGEGMDSISFNREELLELLRP